MASLQKNLASQIPTFWSRIKFDVCLFIDFKSKGIAIFEYTSEFSGIEFKLFILQRNGESFSGTFQISQKIKTDPIWGGIFVALPILTFNHNKYFGKNHIDQTSYFV